MFADSAHLVVSILLTGVGLIFLSTDRGNPASRALAYCLLALGPAMVFRPAHEVTGLSVTITAFMQVCETLAMLFGIEWGRRLCFTASSKSRVSTAAQVLFRVSQLVVLVFGLLSMGYVLIFPEYAVIDPDGVVKVRAVEFAVFAPLLGTAMLLSGLAILLLILTPIDPAERIRLRALLVAGPLFLLTLMVQDDIEPLVMALGLVVFLGGAVRYLIIQSQRGTAMQQFLSPELARMVNRQGMDTALRRERREISVVACDLRGFTHYARNTDSDTVVSLLEDYYARIGAIAARFGGTVKDHAGDGVLILVGAPSAWEDQAWRAVQLARAIIVDAPDILQRATTTALGLGVGVATGEATVGAIHGAGRLEYVAVGNVVNLAARLCDRAADREILLDTRTRSAAGIESGTLSRPAEALKGYAEPVPVFALDPGVPLHAESATSTRA